ncbi:outer kinetochore KNL1 complex subunit KNL1 [Petromyzon marinus]|uniref:Kinetochore scaffold 1 n=1 Tax=Petromyzon marinus TaxID=7757 RepID=A0AAJ7XDA8_PETMA|nr:kinetochore scaffold 1 [Petromyzon marinus]
MFDDDESENSAQASQANHRKRLSSILKVPEKPVLEERDDNKMQADTVVRRKSLKLSRRVSFATTDHVKEFNTETTFLGVSVDGEPPGKVEAGLCEDASLPVGQKIAGLDTLLHGPIQNPAQLTEDGEDLLIIPAAAKAPAGAAKFEKIDFKETLKRLNRGKPEPGGQRFFSDPFCVGDGLADVGPSTVVPANRPALLKPMQGDVPAFPARVPHPMLDRTAIFEDDVMDKKVGATALVEGDFVEPLRNKRMAVESQTRRDDPYCPPSVPFLAPANGERGGEAEEEMEMTRSHTVVIRTQEVETQRGGVRASVPYGHKSTYVPKAVDLTGSRTPFGLREAEHATLRRSAPREEQPPRHDVTIGFEGNEVDMEMTKSHTVVIRSDPTRSLRENFDEAEMEMTRSHTALIRNDPTRSLGEKYEEADMEMTRSHTAVIRNEVMVSHKSNSDEADMEMTRSHTAVICNDLTRSLREKYEEADMEMTRSHTAVICNDPTRSLGEKYGEADMEMTRSHTAVIRNDLTRSLGEKYGEADMEMTRSHTAVIRNEPTRSLGEKYGEADMEMTRSHTAVIHNDLTRSLGEKYEEADMEMTRSHTAVIHNDLTRSLGEKYEEADMEMTRSHTAVIRNDPTRSLREKYEEADMEMTRSHTAVICNETTRSLREKYGEADMEMTRSHTAVICNDLTRSLREKYEEADMEMTRSHTAVICNETTRSLREKYGEADMEMTRSHTAVICNETTRSLREKYGEADMEMTRSHTAVIHNEPTRSLGEKYEEADMEMTRSHTAVIRNDLTRSLGEKYGEADMEMTRSHTAMIRNEPTRSLGEKYGEADMEMTRSHTAVIRNDVTNRPLAENYNAATQELRARPSSVAPRGNRTVIFHDEDKVEVARCQTVAITGEGLRGVATDEPSRASTTKKSGGAKSDVVVPRSGSSSSSSSAIIECETTQLHGNPQPARVEPKHVSAGDRRASSPEEVEIPPHGSGAAAADGDRGVHEGSTRSDRPIVMEQPVATAEFGGQAGAGRDSGEAGGDGHQQARADGGGRTTAADTKPIVRAAAANNMTIPRLGTVARDAESTELGELPARAQPKATEEVSSLGKSGHLGAEENKVKLAGAGVFESRTDKVPKELLGSPVKEPVALLVEPNGARLEIKRDAAVTEVAVAARPTDKPTTFLLRKQLDKRLSLQRKQPGAGEHGTHRRATMLLPFASADGDTRPHTDILLGRRYSSAMALTPECTRAVRRRLSMLQAARARGAGGGDDDDATACSRRLTTSDRLGQLMPLLTKQVQLADLEMEMALQGGHLCEEALKVVSEIEKTGSQQAVTNGDFHTSYNMQDETMPAVGQQELWTGQLEEHTEGGGTARQTAAQGKRATEEHSGGGKRRRSDRDVEKLACTDEPEEKEQEGPTILPAPQLSFSAEHGVLQASPSGGNSRIVTDGFMPAIAQACHNISLTSSHEGWVDGNVTIRAFMKIMLLEATVALSRHSEIMVMPQEEEERGQRLRRMVRERHVVIPKMRAKEEQLGRLQEQTAQLTGEGGDRLLKSLDPQLCRRMMSCKQTEHDEFLTELRAERDCLREEAKHVYARASMEQLTELLAQMQGHLEVLENRVQQTKKTLEDINFYMAQMDDESVNDKDRVAEPVPSRALLLDKKNELTELANEKKEVKRLQRERRKELNLVAKTLRKQQQQLLVPVHSVSEYHRLTGWELQWWQENEAVFLFLHGSLEAKVKFGKRIDGLTFAGQPVREISDIHLTWQLDDSPFPEATSLLQRLLLAGLGNHRTWAAQHRSSLHLPKMLHELTLVAERARGLNEDVAFLLGGTGLRYDLVRASVDGLRLGCVFSSLSAFCKFRVDFELQPGYPFTPLQFEVRPLIGKPSVEQQVSHAVRAVPMGWHYLTRVVHNIHASVLAGGGKSGGAPSD